ncbi:sensor histidine kinase [Parapedobacter koreensis]|uniref:histidine kinase n=1 Tax=Parapedobacter koreensis TaxID=332977 RepID=A0A1H7MUP5_9SPHI|nr:ATP-binding protein [Parapedobacter koreensis]SEL15002.1 Histidine kinase [Parapedobacter koreensis]
METSSNEIIIAFLFGSLMLALVGAFMFVMVIFYQKRKIKSIEDRQRLIAQYEQAVLKAKVEIREETLKYVGQELHDNVGQLLSLIKLYLSRPDTKQKTDVKQLIDQAITDIRSLSHDLNINRVEQYSLSDFIAQELNKVHKTGIVKTAFDNEGHCEPVNVQSRVMISRIFQECINNIIKHAEAKHIFVKLAAEKGSCILSIADDGIGFETNTVQNGSGLVNMHDRMKLIGGDIQVVSSLGNGTNITLRIPQG